MGVLQNSYFFAYECDRAIAPHLPQNTPSLEEHGPCSRAALTLCQPAPQNPRPMPRRGCRPSSLLQGCDRTQQTPSTPLPSLPPPRPLCSNTGRRCLAPRRGQPPASCPPCSIPTCSTTVPPRVQAIKPALGLRSPPAALPLHR